MAGSSTADQATFYFDFASPESYLVAERILRVLRVPCAWCPVLASELRDGIGFGGWRCAEEREIELAQFELLAARQALQPVRWPAELPVDSEYAMRVATYAASIGRAVAFAQAAFRQIYAGGRDLSVPDNVLIAAAACEMHPKAVLEGRRAALGARRTRVSDRGGHRPRRHDGARDLERGHRALRGGRPGSRRRGAPMS